MGCTWKKGFRVAVLIPSPWYECHMLQGIPRPVSITSTVSMTLKVMVGGGWNCLSMVLQVCRESSRVPVSVQTSNPTAFRGAA